MEERGVADIGRRSSRDNGNRAAMQMLARLIRRDRYAGLSRMKWKFPLANGKTQGDDILFVVPERWIEVDNSRYANVKKRPIYAAAKRSGTSLDLPFYGALDFDHPVKINLGRQPSFDAGSRAASQVIAKSYKNPRRAIYEIRWSCPSNGQNTDFFVGHASLERTAVGVASSPHRINVKESRRENMTYDAVYSDVSQRVVSKVARRRGLLP